MNRKQKIGWFSIALGVVLMAAAIHSMNKFSNSTGFSNGVKHFFTKNPLWNPMISFFGGSLEESPPDYALETLVTQILGIIFIVGGSVIVIVSRRKK